MSRHVFRWGYFKTHPAGTGRSCQDRVGAPDRTHHGGAHPRSGRHRTPLSSAAPKCFARQGLKLNAYLGEPGLKKSQAKKHLPERGLIIIILPGDILLGMVTFYCRYKGELRAFGSAHTYRRYKTSHPFVPNQAGVRQLHSQLLQDGQKSSSSWQLQLQ